MSRLSTEFLLVAMICLPALCRADPVLEEIIEQKYNVSPTAKFSIRNTDGSIRLYGADITELKVQAVKKAYKPDRLKEISVNVSVQPDRISINTKFPSPPRWPWSDRSGTVDYIVILPQTCAASEVELTTGEVLVEGMRGGEVRARLVNGRMFGHNCFGDLFFNVVNGGLDVGYDWWEERHVALNASITNGNTRVFLPWDAAFRLRAAAPNGHVVSDFVEKRDRVGGMKQLDTVVGQNPAANLELRSGNGSVQVAELNF